MGRPKSQKPGRKVVIDLDAWEAADIDRGYAHETMRECISRLVREGAKQAAEARARSRREEDAGPPGQATDS